MPAALHSEGNRAASCLKLNYLEFELASTGDGELIAAIMAGSLRCLTKARCVTATMLIAIPACQAEKEDAPSQSQAPAYAACPPLPGAELELSEDATSPPRKCFSCV